MSERGARDHLPIIAIGASAGGLEACRALLKDIPGDSRAAFILILHLDPTHDSMMVDLLAGHTRLKVVQASEGMALRPGCLYVIPPGVFLTVAQRVLHLSEPEGGKGVRLPFDVLLRSLARDAGAPTGCIVLSGTGTDGSAGLAEIHAAGGLVIAQDPKEASFPGMPDSAIATGFVDRTLPAGEMAGALETYLKSDPHYKLPATANELSPIWGLPRNLGSVGVAPHATRASAKETNRRFSSSHRCFRADLRLCPRVRR